MPLSWAGYKYGAQACRRPGRGTSMGLISGCHVLFLRALVLAAFVQKRPGLLKFASFLPAFPLGVTGWLIIEHGHTVRFVDGRFGTVRMCVARGVDANVFTCFSVGGTGMNGVTVRLFFTAGGIGDPPFFRIFRFSPGGSGWSFCPAALSPAPWVLRGVVLRAGGPGVWWLLSVSLRLLAR